MSRKILKQLKGKLPNLTPEQVDAFDKFYSTTKADPFKTFDEEKDFKEYMDKKVGETTNKLQGEINTLKNEENFKLAEKAFGETNKASMFKYVSKNALNEDGTFKEEAKKNDFWKAEVAKLDDKDNYVITQPNLKVANNNRVEDKEGSTKQEPKRLYY